MLYTADLLARLEAGVRAALPNWGVSESATVRLLTISENATFVVEDGATKLICRVHRPGYHSREEILSELAWIDALRAETVVLTPRPMPGRDGAPLQSFSDGNEERFVVFFEHVPGREPDAVGDLPFWFRHLGALTARLHGHSRRFALPAGFARKRWSFETIIGPSAYWGDWRAAAGLGADGRAILERTAAGLKRATDALGQAPERFGLIHCDMRASNLLVEDDRMSVIDFDDCGFSWYGYDFAASVSFIEHEPILPELCAAWTDGYRSAAELDPSTEAALSMFVMLRRMQLTAWLASHAETPTAEELGPGFADGTVSLAEAWLSGGLVT